MEMIEAAPAVFNLENPKQYEYYLIPKETWIKIFKEALPIVLARNSKRKYMKLGIALALTHPDNIFTDEDIINDKLIAGDIANAWAASYSTYGAIWNEEPNWCVDLTDAKLTTKAWRNSPLHTKNAVPPFAEDQIFGEGNSLHNVEQELRHKLQIQDAENPDKWTKQITRLLALSGQVFIKAGNAKDIILRLAKTNPKAFGKDMMLDDTKLMTNTLTALWAGTNAIFGDAWKLYSQSTTEKKDDDKVESGKPTTSSAKSNLKNIAATTKLPPRTVPPSGVGFVAGTKPNKPASKLFLSKKPITPIAEKLKGPKRKYSSFFKARLPRVINPYGPLAEEEVINAFNALLKIFWEREKKVLVMQWKNSNGKPLTQDSEPLKSRTQIQLYVDNCFIKQGANAWI